MEIYGLVFPSVACLIGYVLGWKQPSWCDNMTQRVSKLLIWFVFPILIYLSITLKLNKESLSVHWFLPAGTFIMMLMGRWIGGIRSRGLSFADRSEKHTFEFMATLPNYIFLPMVIVQTFWGPKAVALLILTTLGSEIALWVLAVPLLKERQPGDGLFNNCRNMLTPPLLALGFAVGTLASDSSGMVAFLKPAESMISVLGFFTSALAFFLMGYHLGAVGRFEWPDKRQAFLLFHRLLLMPSLVLAALFWVNQNGVMGPEAEKVIFLIAMMPPAMASVLMADMFDGDPKFAAMTVLQGHVAGVFTIPFWLVAIGKLKYFLA